MGFNILNIPRHLRLVLTHKRRVFINCARCGIPFRGIVHDLSKFSPVEFFEAARFYQGNRSPIGVCRRTTGKSYAWLHHKGRNKHHLEYWYDPECAELPLVPYKYIVECVCDKLAATRTYAGANYTSELPLFHWEKYGSLAEANPKSKKFIEKVFHDVKDKGEKFVLRPSYMKKTYRELCGSEEKL